MTPATDTQIDLFAWARELEQENERIAEDQRGAGAPPRIPRVRHRSRRVAGRPRLPRGLRHRGQDAQPGRREGPAARRRDGGCAPTSRPAPTRTSSPTPAGSRRHWPVRELGDHGGVRDGPPRALDRGGSPSSLVSSGRGAGFRIRIGTSSWLPTTSATIRTALLASTVRGLLAACMPVGCRNAPAPARVAPRSPGGCSSHRRA